MGKVAKFVCFRLSQKPFSCFCSKFQGTFRWAYRQFLANPHLCVYGNQVYQPILFLFSKTFRRAYTFIDNFFLFYIGIYLSLFLFDIVDGGSVRLNVSWVCLCLCEFVIWLMLLCNISIFLLFHVCFPYFWLITLVD